MFLCLILQVRNLRQEVHSLPKVTQLGCDWTPSCICANDIYYGDEKRGWKWLKGTLNEWTFCILKRNSILVYTLYSSRLDKNKVTKWLIIPNVNFSCPKVLCLVPKFETKTLIWMFCSFHDSTSWNVRHLLRVRFSHNGPCCKETLRCFQTLKASFGEGAKSDENLCFFQNLWNELG